MAEDRSPIGQMFDTGDKGDKPSPSEEFRKGFLDEQGGLKAEQALSAAWENKRDRDRLAGRVSELEKAAKDGVGEDVEAYLQGFDREKLKETSPKAYRGEEDDPVLKGLLDSARQAGIPVARAQDLASRYYAARNGLLPDVEEKTPEQKFAEAVAAHPNGELIAQDVAGWLEQQHKARAFGKEELGVLDGMRQSVAGLSVLFRLSRRGSPAPADMGRTLAVADPDAERREVMRLLGTQDEAEWKKVKDEALRRYEALPPKA